MLTPRKSKLLLTALLEEYPGEILTGYILDVQVKSYCLVGNIYKSPSHPNGTQIIAEIGEVVDYGDRYLVRSGNYDCFVIVNFHPRGGRRALHYTLKLFENAGGCVPSSSAAESALIVSQFSEKSTLSAYATRRLSEAYRYAFAWPVTAYLTDVSLVSCSALGRTYRHRRADIFGRFHDGHRIRTSDVRQVQRCGAFWCIYTASGSRYVVATFDPQGGRQSLKRWQDWAARGLIPTPGSLQ